MERSLSLGIDSYSVRILVTKPTVLLPKEDPPSSTQNSGRVLVTLLTYKMGQIILFST